MSSLHSFSEDTLVEQPTIKLFAALGWETVDGFQEFGQAGTSSLGRKGKSEVVLEGRLRVALNRLNPDLPTESCYQAIEALTRDRSAMAPAQANREVYLLLKNGVPVKTPDPDGEGETVEPVRIIDWGTPDNNDFLLVNQFCVTGDMYTRRADLVGFVNGLPLVFIELKATHARLKLAYEGNLKDYKNAIPQLFWYNALIILSNGSHSRIGTMTASWEHFAEWKRINSEGEQGVISLETMIQGTCHKSRLLDLVENFTLFMEAGGGLIKLLGKNHQYLGINNAIEALENMGTSTGKLGVFWHTQGSGKSISMICFAQKVLRKKPGNWTFVIITDRRELDIQIYSSFTAAGAVTEQQVQATSRRHLRQLLSEDHRYVFTLIHKFGTKPGEKHPVLSQRSHIIVITDEAHRSQYDTLALNMRSALPNASFIAFTGTPLIIGEEKTREVFGDYVSVYNFHQSVEDGATVPLYYENRIPELQLTNKDLNEDMERLLENAELDEVQENKLEREFARQYHLITREERLETIAEDLVRHFTGRGFPGKAMVISIDKATAVRMYDKVQVHWRGEMGRLRDEMAKPVSDQKRQAIRERLEFMETTNMAVVVSPSQNEVEDMKSKGLDIRPHRQRMNREDLETRFKNPTDAFRMVFVCAMWLTGFDAPSCSTLYLDKPMGNHTLIQTIARANRVFKEKMNGLIVDYVGVFRNLEKALGVYGTGGGSSSDSPVQDKKALVALLQQSIIEIGNFCRAMGIDLDAIGAARGFKKIRLLDDAVEVLIASEDSKKQYLTQAATIGLWYKAILPDSAAGSLIAPCLLINVLAKKIRALAPPADISTVMGQVGELLDESIDAEGYVIRDVPAIYGAPGGKDQWVDLSQMDFQVLKERFAKGRKHTEVEKLKGQVCSKLKQMLRLNRSRMNYWEQFQKMIHEYNAGSLNIDEFFEQLMALAESLKEEEKRSITEQLSEEELALFDILTKSRLGLSAEEIKQVKTAARKLLEVLKGKKLVLDWRKFQQSRAEVKISIGDLLDEGLPESFTPELFTQKVNAVYEHVFDSYYGGGRGIYLTIP